MKGMMMVVVVAVALMLAGCGGGSKTASMMPTSGIPKAVLVNPGAQGERDSPQGPGVAPGTPSNPGEGERDSPQGPGVDPETPPPTSTDSVGWDQLPSLLDRSWLSRGTYGSYGGLGSGGEEDTSWINGWGGLSTLGGLTGQDKIPCHTGTLDMCRTLLKNRIEAATEVGPVAVSIEAETGPTGTIGRFQGTTIAQITKDGVEGPVTFWGAWLDNSMFLLERKTLVAHGIESRAISFGRYGMIGGEYVVGQGYSLIQGTYRGVAVDIEGNWGTSELNYTAGSGQKLGQVDLTINIPDNRFGVMTFPGVPVTDRTVMWGEFPYPEEYGASRLNDSGDLARFSGYFWRGNEVGGSFVYRNCGGVSPCPQTVANTTAGAFGAKLVP